MEALIGLIGTVIGACIAGYFVFRREKQQRDFLRQKDKRDLLLQKYELIFKELTNYSAFVSEISMQMISEVGYGGKFDVQKFSRNLRDCGLVMNVTFYAPEISPEIREIELKHAVAARALTDFLLNRDASHEEKSKFTGDAAIASAELQKIASLAKEKLAKLASEQVNA